MEFTQTPLIGMNEENQGVLTFVLYLTNTHQI